MASKRVIDLIKEYFSIGELVSPDTLSYLGERKCWELFGDNARMMFYHVRKSYGKPL